MRGVKHGHRRLSCANRAATMCTAAPGKEGDSARPTVKRSVKEGDIKRNAETTERYLTKPRK